MLHIHPLIRMSTARGDRILKEFSRNSIGYPGNHRKTDGTQIFPTTGITNLRRGREISSRYERTQPLSPLGENIHYKRTGNSSIRLITLTLRALKLSRSTDPSSFLRSGLSEGELRRLRFPIGVPEKCRTRKLHPDLRMRIESRLTRRVFL